MPRIKVFARIRQNLKGETGEKIKFQDGTSQPQGKSPPPASENFDHVFESSRKLEDVYVACLSDLVNPFLEGYNAAFVVFGETDSGQFRTVLGGEVGNILKSSKKSSGLLNMLVEDLFKGIKEIDTQKSGEIVLKLAIVEIKGNSITDLMFMSNGNEDGNERDGKNYSIPLTFRIILVYSPSDVINESKWQNVSQTRANPKF